MTPEIECPRHGLTGDSRSGCECAINSNQGTDVGRSYRETIEYLQRDNTRLRLELFNSESIRGMLAGSAKDVAKDMVRAIELLEAAFHAGAKFRDTVDDQTVDRGFREWFRRTK